MKNNWQTKKLGEIIKLEYGKPHPKEVRKNDGKYPVYGANGIKSYSDSYYFDKPSIIVGRKGSAGELKITADKFWPLDVTYFVTFDEKKYDLKLLYLLLSTLNLPKLAKGVKPGINRNDVYSIEINIPNSLVEQTRIVNHLDEVLATLSEREAKVLKLRFGLEGTKQMTLEEVGRNFSVTRERIRQIEAKALRKLRHPSRAKRLRSFVD